MRHQVSKIYSSKNFLHNKSDKTLTAEASQLSSTSQTIFCNLYDDACDIGFGIQSDKTEKVGVFCLSDSDIYLDEEGDVLYYVLRPTHKTIKDIPQLKDYKIFIFND